MLDELNPWSVYVACLHFDCKIKMGIVVALPLALATSFGVGMSASEFKEDKFYYVENFLRIWRLGRIQMVWIRFIWKIKHCT